MNTANPIKLKDHTGVVHWLPINDAGIIDLKKEDFDKTPSEIIEGFPNTLNVFSYKLLIPKSQIAKSGTIHDSDKKGQLFYIRNSARKQLEEQSPDGNLTFEI